MSGTPRCQSHPVFYGKNAFSAVLTRVAMLANAVPSLRFEEQTSSTRRRRRHNTLIALAVVPDATVTRTNTEHVEARDPRRRATRVLRVVLRQPGTYNVSISKQGFKTT